MLPIQLVQQLHHSIRKVDPWPTDAVVPCSCRREDADQLTENTAITLGEATTQRSQAGRERGSRVERAEQVHLAVVGNHRCSLSSIAGSSSVLDMHGSVTDPSRENDSQLFFVALRHSVRDRQIYR